MDKALERVAEIAALGVGEVDVSVIPPRRLAELWRYGMDGKATLIDRHGVERKLATLLATMVHLTIRSVDDALDLLDLLIATRLLARAERESSKEKLRTLPRVERASATLAEAVRVLIEATDDRVDVATGEVLAPGPASVDEVWAAIEAVVPRQQLTAALEAIIELTPPTDSDADEAWRAMLVGRFAMVRPFLSRLCEVIEFGATAEGRPMLAALRALPALMERKRVTPDEIDVSLLAGSWRRLVLRAPHLQEGLVDWKAYAFACWSSSTGCCAAGRSSRSTPPSGVTRAPNSCRVRRGRRCGPQCWPACACPSSRART
ncbi:hypothetical protein GCM10022419_121950 [Nonomuraea rosea]|uniref:Uncharacterized protein n=1 Tax=Nonomuraea rosea TaxID=638574 RepID=A0ABP6ZQ62_9ACTN